MLALGLRLDLPVSGGLVEDDHNARGFEDGVFRHLVDRPCFFHVSMPPHLLFVSTPPHLQRMAVSVTGWPKFGMSYILSGVGDCIQLAIAVYPAYGAKTWPDCLFVPGFSFHFPVFDWLLTSLKYLTQSANILSVATQVYLSFQCWAAA